MEQPEKLPSVDEVKDVHLAKACEMFGVEPEAVTAEMRRSARMSNFGVIYGKSPDAVCVTGNHKVLCQDGRYKKVSDLTVGDRISKTNKQS